jgi:hypothetical protein
MISNRGRTTIRDDVAALQDDHGPPRENRFDTLEHHVKDDTIDRPRHRRSNRPQLKPHWGAPVAERSETLDLKRPVVI